MANSAIGFIGKEITSGDAETPTDSETGHTIHLRYFALRSALRNSSTSIAVSTYCRCTSIQVSYISPASSASATYQEARMPQSSAKFSRYCTVDISTGSVYLAHMLKRFMYFGAM